MLGPPQEPGMESAPAGESQGLLSEGQSDAGQTKPQVSTLGDEGREGHKAVWKDLET